jgi:pilus assembly protein CpaF
VSASTAPSPTHGLAERLHARIASQVGPATDLDAEAVAELARREAPLLGPVELSRVVGEVVARAGGLGKLQPLLVDPDVTEVMVSGPDRVWVERQGRLCRVEMDIDGPTIEHLIEKIVGPLGLHVDRASPMVDARLPDGSRVNAVVPPLAVDGPCLTIRRFSRRPLPLERFCAPAVARLLCWAVRARLNLLVSGATSSGKTTLLNALSAEIPLGERIITVEDAAELALPQEHVVRLEARPANADGTGSVTVRDLVRNALRMRPDRIVVGEVRDAAALDMLQAMNTGHEGSLSTCHANSPVDAFRRVETMVLMGEVALPLAAVREQVVSALDLVIQVARGSDGARRVVEVAEVSGPSEVRRLACGDVLEQHPNLASRSPSVSPFDEPPFDGGRP